MRENHVGILIYFQAGLPIIALEKSVAVLAFPEMCSNKLQYINKAFSPNFVSDKVPKDVSGS